MTFFPTTAVKTMGMTQALILGSWEHACASQEPSGAHPPLSSLFTVQESGCRIYSGHSFKFYMFMIYVNIKLLIWPKIMRNWKDFRDRFQCFLRKYSWTWNKGIIHLFPLLNKSYDFKLLKGVWPSTDSKAVPVPGHKGSLLHKHVSKVAEML